MILDFIKMAHSIISRQCNTPRHTLSFVEGDEKSLDSESQEVVHTLVTDKVKTEKSVRFAKEDESATDERESVTDSLQTSKDIITWVPSEHLYSEDTFIAETFKANGDNQTTLQTEPTYGTSTFVELDTDDETNTETLSSHTCTESFASSDVFSSQNGSSLYRSWKDVTEIVKDIEELEESEFVTRADATYTSFDEGEVTEAENSFEEQLARHEFLEHAILYLLRKKDHSPRSLSDDSYSTTNENFTQKYLMKQAFTGAEKKQANKFCQKAMKILSQKKDSKEDTADCQKQKNISPLYLEAWKKNNVILENFGLSSATVDKLKMENFHHKLKRKTETLNKDIEESEDFVKDHKYVEEENLQKQFLSKACAHVLRDNTDDKIQSHLINLHPVKCFAEFINELPEHGGDMREVLYQYKRQIENRMKADMME